VHRIRSKGSRNRAPIGEDALWEPRPKPPVRAIGGPNPDKYHLKHEGIPRLFPLRRGASRLYLEVTDIVPKKGASGHLQRAARLALAVVVLMIATVLIPWPSHRGLNTEANAQIVQPTPDLSSILGRPSPKETDEDGGGGGGGGKEGGSDDDDGGILPGGGNEEDKGKEGDAKGKGKDSAGQGKGKRGDKGVDAKGRRRGKKKKKKDKDEIPASVVNLIPGAFSTKKLVAVAAQLSALGWAPKVVIRRVYPPFIIAGPASWVDTWHAPRYGPAPGQIRQHEGQDVFCDYGDPVLAPEPGTVSFSDGGLGGITARVHKPDGSYWYLTHLSDLNKEELSAGDSVGIGDVLGYCGNSGNAATTPPHVHFGWYRPNGKAKNPMQALINWLRTAERRVDPVVAKTIKKRVRQAPLYRAERLFGDAFAPDRSEFRVAGESLWASGSDPGIGTYALAEAALRAALATRGVEYEKVFSPDAYLEEELDVQTSLDPNSALARLLQSQHVSAGEMPD
jgi:murein DD-endopeptidase MepM/ murein hydrolase activator NlpD